MCLFYKRLDRHAFRIPTAITPGTTTIELNEREFDDLLDAIEIEVVVRKSRSKRSVRIH
jgi:hypothetical protein